MLMLSSLTNGGKAIGYLMTGVKQLLNLSKNGKAQGWFAQITALQATLRWQNVCENHNRNRRTLSMHGVSRGLIQALQSLYRGSRGCVGINGAYTDWFDIRRGIRQGCVALPWLSYLFISCLYDLKEYQCGCMRCLSNGSCTLTTKQSFRRRRADCRR
ncbi:hypothetical protein EVAR_46828_1 [Eumeta japonica]|uniref:Reverse transcriptase domain-containing protein n=1 Tax=Eumeta variegata TaxID=151549 RepID=A0A4C2AB04_EUMVA|nr:hypothetical protein EVAR_46828_1 [Eumeta japonica]